MEEYLRERYAAAAASLSKKLVRRNFQPIICQNLEEAKERALEKIDQNQSVGFGGSITIEQSGIIEELYQRGQKMIDREKTTSPEQRHQVMKQALTADCFLTSINGITEDGELVNIDSVGNRVAALTYGPDKVFAFVSMRKVYGDLNTTLEMVRRNTAPLNAHRLGLEKTPCIKKGTCGDLFTGGMYLQYDCNHQTFNGKRPHCDFFDY
ncbi:lactate utilization protein [Enterococcus hulanensis]|uniref:lactate utilization protein n=1 Tax=Enterococcus hulanensis TaxID=2559929 RepID=UPI00288DB7E1|nr:lactate utilization protein [Enterococcus hulanensis]MDT2658862.1 lactate utilization protein [Enterococcus hulanensis]